MALNDMLVLRLATGMGISYIAPIGKRKWTGAGLLGTFEGLLLWFLLPNNSQFYAALVCLSIIAAIWLCGKAQTLMRTHDDPRIVLDEIVGFWVAAAFLPRTWLAISLAFILFRVFDSVKLPPYSWLERAPGGYGVVLDDIGAGIIANITTRLLLARAL